MVSYNVSPVKFNNGGSSQDKSYGEIFASSNTGTILIVDDDVDCRMILRTILEQEGYCCVEAEDGMTALALFHEQKIDFIFTDFQMPKMNGCEFLEELSKEQNIIPPAVMITGNLHGSVKRKARHAGAMSVLSKPVDRIKILEIIRKGDASKMSH